MARGAIATAIEPIAKFEIMDAPVGKAIVMTAGMGVFDALKGFLRQWIPPIASGLLIGIALPQVGFVKRMLGPTATELLSLAVIADTINDQFALQQKVGDWVAGIVKPGSRVISTSPPRIVSAQPRVQSIGGNQYAAILGQS